MVADWMTGGTVIVVRVFYYFIIRYADRVLHYRKQNFHGKHTKNEHKCQPVLAGLENQAETFMNTGMKLEDIQKSHQLQT